MVKSQPFKLVSQEKHHSKVRQEVERRELVSLMNNTRWRQFQKAMEEELPFPPLYIRKDILNEAHRNLTEDGYGVGDYREGLLPFYSIEWIEVRPRILQHEGQLVKPHIESIENEFVAVLHRYRMAYKIENGTYFIYGYISDFSQLSDI